MKHDPFSGVMTAVITPFLPDKKIDLKSFHRILESQKKAGIHGVVILGSTGENATLTDAEAQSLVQEALEHRTDDFHIYVGTGTNNTLTTIEKSFYFSQLKSKSGEKADGVMVVTPYYNKPAQRHLILHYKEVCSAIPDTPVCLYNVPGRTGVNLQPSTLAQIALENPNLVAIKEAAGNLNAITEMRLALDAMNKKHMRILSGDDATFCPAMLCGADGVISVTTHLIPNVMLDMWSAVHQGHFEHARDLHLKSYSLNSGIFSVPNPVGVKCLLSEQNMCENVLRAPLYPATGDEVIHLKKLLSPFH